MTKLSAFSAASLLVLLAACGVPRGNAGGGQAAPTAKTPGWTGSTVVPGNNSTIAGDAAATYQQQRWPMERGR